VLEEELVVLDADSPLWNAARPLLAIALQIEQQDEGYSWHGWHKREITTFLKGLPAHCALLVGVWEGNEGGTGEEDQGMAAHGEHVEMAQPAETLVLGCVCEVIEGEVHSIRTFDALVDAELPPVAQLEPGIQHALELIHVTKKQVAPVAWALFTDKATWDEWLFTENASEDASAKGELLAALALQGRCVLLGNQTAHYH